MFQQAIVFLFFEIHMNRPLLGVEWEGGGGGGGGALAVFEEDQSRSDSGFRLILANGRRLRYIFTSRKRSLRRLCFHKRLSSGPGGVGQTHPGRRSTSGQYECILVYLHKITAHPNHHVEDNGKITIFVSQSMIRIYLERNG